MNKFFHGFTRETLDGVAVRVYRNLHKKCFSVQAKVDGRWLVVAHLSRLWVLKATLQVSQKGRERVLREKAKNVHAYVLGTFQDGEPLKSSIFNARGVTYNPYKFRYFMQYSLTEPAKPMAIQTKADLIRLEIGATSPMLAYDLETIGQLAARVKAKT